MRIVWNKRNAQDFLGKKYGYLTIISESDPNKHKQRCVIAKCDCGVIKAYALAEVIHGVEKGCGCRRLIMLKNKITTHGLSKHLVYKLWLHLKSRCYNKQNKCYKDYGGRGIYVCKEWLDSFPNFYEWCINNGWAKGLKIDRKDNDGIYSPDNCRFVTNQVNCMNKRNTAYLTYKGETKTMVDWAKQYNLTYSALSARIHTAKMTVEEALLKPHRYKINKFYSSTTS